MVVRCDRRWKMGASVVLGLVRSGRKKVGLLSRTRTDLRCRQPDLGSLHFVARRLGLFSWFSDCLCRCDGGTDLLEVAAYWVEQIMGDVVVRLVGHCRCLAVNSGVPCNSLRVPPLEAVS